MTLNSQNIEDSWEHKLLTRSSPLLANQSRDISRRRDLNQHRNSDQRGVTCGKEGQKRHNLETRLEPPYPTGRIIQTTLFNVVVKLTVQVVILMSLVALVSVVIVVAFPNSCGSPRF